MAGGAQLLTVYRTIAAELIAANVNKDAERVRTCRTLLMPAARRVARAAGIVDVGGGGRRMTKTWHEALDAARVPPRRDPGGARRRQPAASAARPGVPERATARRARAPGPGTPRAHARARTERHGTARTAPRAALDGMPARPAARRRPRHRHFVDVGA